MIITLTQGIMGETMNYEHCYLPSAKVLILPHLSASGVWRVSMVDTRLHHRLGISGPFIRHDHIHVIADVLFDVPRQRPSLGIFGVEETEFSIALANADYDFFGPLANKLALAEFLSTDVSFIHFNGASQLFGFSFLHHSANAMAQIPSSLIRNSQGPFDLVSTHAFAGFAEQVNAEKPLPEWKVRIIEDRSSGDGELIAA